MTLTNILSTSSIAKPTNTKHRIDEQLQTIAFRSQAHLPPAPTLPHIPAPKSSANASGAAAGSASSSSSSGSEAREKKKAAGGVKAKASTKQKKRNAKQTERAIEFAEKLSARAEDVDTRKAKRDRAKRIWE